MFRSATKLELGGLEDSVPAFLTVALIPLTFSITQGILWGFVSHTTLYVLAGRHKEIPVMLYIIAAISALLLVLH